MVDDTESKTALQRTDWHEAAARTASLIDRGKRKRYLVARELGWSPSKLSRVLNGKQLPSRDELGDVEAFLVNRVEGYVSGGIVDIWYPASAPDDPNASASPSEEAAGPTPSRHLWTTKAMLIPGVFVIAILVVFAGKWALSAANDPSETVSTSTGCIFAPGETTPGNSERLARYVPLFEQALAQAGGSDVVGCPSSTMEIWQDLVVQPLAFADRPGGAIVAADDSTAVVLSWTAWISYRQIGGKSGDNAQELAGLPVRVRTEDGLWIVDLDRGGYLVAEAEDAPYFWAPELAAARIDEHGGLTGELGRPTGYPQVKEGYFEQDFLHGIATLDPDGTIQVELIDDPTADLGTFEPIEDRILRQTDGTAWYVTSDRTRQWIPDGDVWECLGGWDNVTGNDVPGWAVASLPYDGHASCP